MTKQETATLLVPVMTKVLALARSQGSAIAPDIEAVLDKLKQEASEPSSTTHEAKP